MTFIQNTEILIRKSDKCISKIFFKNGINIVNFDSNFELISSSKVIDNIKGSTDIWFDIDEQDNIYGIYDDKQGSLIKIDINNDKINKASIINYDNSKYTISFPYISKIGKDTHIIYYLRDNKSKLYKLVHNIKRDKEDIMSIIDIVGYEDINNFTVICDNTNISMFYFKVVKGYEEVFMCTLNHENSIWYNPIQITNSNKEKIHLSVTKGTNNTYHIAYSENNSSKYQPIYKRVDLNKESILINDSVYVNKSSACNIPHIIEHKNVLHMQWIEYGNLNISKSFEFGKSWDTPIIDDDGMEYPFIRYYYKSNCEADKEYKVSTVYGCKNYINILGI